MIRSRCIHVHYLSCTKRNKHNNYDNNCTVDFMKHEAEVKIQNSVWEQLILSATYI